MYILWNVYIMISIYKFINPILSYSKKIQKYSANKRNTKDIHLINRVKLTKTEPQYKVI
jgi:hypothetical protein